MRDNQSIATDTPTLNGGSKLTSYAAATGLVAALLALWTLLTHVLA